MNSKLIALNKVNQETEKSIKAIKQICQQSSYGEFIYCLYFMHVARVLEYDGIESFNEINIRRYIDVSRYIISCLYKYTNITTVPINEYSINIENISLLIKLSNHIHNLHENSSLLTICDDVELQGERNRKIKFDTSKIMEDPIKKKSFEYSARFQREHLIKNKSLEYTVLLNDFEIQYSQYNAIAKSVFGLTVEEIKSKVSELLNIYLQKIKINEQYMPILANGNIDTESFETLKQFEKCFIVSEKELFIIFGKKGMKFIRQFTFKKSNFKSHELNFDYILRRPIFKLKNDYIIVPALLLDSLFKNFHYTLLENQNYSEKHKKIMSDVFVNEILEVGKKHSFEYFNSELELYNGKNKIGDIDLILRHTKDDYDILIEAKNHTPPLSVQFSDYKQINARLKTLQETWEKKVDKRNKYLLENYQKYGIKKTFKYIIVSRYPEILSHYSNYLVMSIAELEFYLQNNAKYICFDSLYHDLCKDDKIYENQKDILDKTLGWETY